MFRKGVFLTMPRIQAAYLVVGTQSLHRLDVEELCRPHKIITLGIGLIELTPSH